MECDKEMSEEKAASAEIANSVPVKPKLKDTSTGSTAGKKPVRSKTKPLYFWTSADVNKWLKKHGGHCHELYGDLLLQEEVTGRTLIRINEIKLEKIGITNPQHRQELMQCILKLRLKHEAVDLKNLDQKGSGFELPVPDTKKQSIKR